ncbi:flippase [Thiotrichales bacterium 19X7-9]|nr:flippase [Thiotrichales bacterium 19X7-9]
MSHDLIAGTSWQLIERFINLFLSFFISIYLIRYLGPERFGIWSYAQSYVFLFATLTTMGLQVVLVKELSKNEKNQEELMGTAFVIMLIGSMLMVVISLLIAYFYQGINNTTFWMIALLVLSNVILSFNVIQFYFQSVSKTKLTAIALLCQDFIDALGKLVFIVYNLPLLFLGVIYCIEVMFMIVILIIFYSKNFAGITLWRFNYALAKSLLKISLPLALAGAMVSLYMRLDQVMLEYFNGMSIVGEYSAAVKLVEIWYMFPMIIIPNLLPYYVKAVNHHSDLFFKAVKGIYCCCILVTVSISLILSYFDKEIINLLFGIHYNHSALILKISVWTSVFVFLNVATVLYYYPKNLEKYIILRSFFGLLVNVVANFILIPSYGGVGAAYATLLAQFSTVFISALLIPKWRENFIYLCMGVVKFRDIGSIIKIIQL